MDPWQPLLDFWFGDLTNGLADDEHRRRWFESNAEFDEECKARFEHFLAPAAAGDLDSWLSHERGHLAYIVLTDQLPRNIYRASANAFAWDLLALAAATEGVQSGHDRRLGWDERSFFYMPFEHSERILDQHLAVGLFTHLRDEAPRAYRSLMGNGLRYAQRHRNVIAQFGRFPHRNEVLGRPSSDAERAYLATSSGFGQ